MKKIFFICLLFLGGGLLLPAMAQQRDSLWVKVINNSWTIVHKMQEGETVFQIARMYEVPPADLAALNGIGYNTKLQAGTDVFIPIGSYNRISKEGVAGARPLYYRTGSGDDWQRMAFLAGTDAAQLRAWNKLPMMTLSPGQVLLVGWVKYNTVLVVKPAPPVMPQTADTAVLDTIPEMPVLSKEEAEFNMMTNEGQNVQTEKGAAVYFDSKTPGNKHYAFYNLAPRGSIIKIVNPGNGHYVFAKVIGTIPDQDRYRNALVGLSLSAQKVLGGKGSRTWCEVQY